MRYIRNPMTAEVREVTLATAIKLSRYGWVYVNRVDYRVWVVMNALRQREIRV